jgi:predicted cupin superfamily sugar epimerase
MAPSAEQIIRLLALRPHPEGGHFAELFRAPLTVTSTVLA